MAFNPTETNSLMALLSGLQGGLSGSTGYSLLQNILGQQQTRIANRQQRMGSLIDMLNQSAVEGGSLEAAQALAGAYTHGANIPPVIQDALGSLYPQEALPSQTSYGVPRGPGDPNTMFSMPVATPPSQVMSPTYSPPPPSPQDLLAIQELQGQQALATQAPAIAQAMASTAIGLIGTPIDPAQPELGTVTPDSVLTYVLQDETFQKLDAQTQALILQTIQNEIAALPTDTAEGAGGAAQAPSYGYPLSYGAIQSQVDKLG